MICRIGVPRTRGVSRPELLDKTMKTYFRTTITQVGPDVADLIEGGVLILFADGAPAELAEV